MGFLSGSFGLSSRRLAAMLCEHDRFDERLEANRGSLARGARANVVGCRLRRCEGANRFDDLQLAARWETRSEIVGGIVMVALMKCHIKTAASRTEAVGRRGEGRR
jgi:hypothetical protein